MLDPGAQKVVMPMNPERDMVPGRCNSGFDRLDQCGCHSFIGINKINPFVLELDGLQGPVPMTGLIAAIRKFVFAITAFNDMGAKLAGNRRGSVGATRVKDMNIVRPCNTL